MTSNPTPARFRHRAEEVEAVQWTGSNADQLRAFAGQHFDTIDPEDRIDDADQDAQVLIEASYWTGISPGYWVLKYEDHLDVERDENFRAAWEPAAPPSVSAVDQTTRDRIAEALAPFFANFSDWESARINAGEATDAVLAVLPPPADRSAILREAADELGRMDYDTDSNDYGYDTYRDAWNGGVMDGADLLRRLADEAQQPEPDDEGDELVCVDECGSCDACGMEPFGTPAEGWREAARFLRRTARESGDRQGALHGARLIEAELRRVAEEARDEQEAQTHLDQLADELPAVGARQPDTETQAHPPQHAWRVETRDPLADQWAPGSHFAHRPAALERWETANRNAPLWRDGTPVERRIVRETTTYTVEVEHQPAAVSAVPGRSAATSTDEEQARG